MDFLEKLDLLMQEKGLNKNTLSQFSDIPYTTIDGWYKRGYAGAKLSTIRKLADYFNTTLDYLMRDEITDKNYGKTYNFQVNSLETEIIEKYRILDEYGKDTVGTILERELYRTKEQKKNMLVREQQASYLCSPAERNYPEGIYQIDDFKNEEEGRISVPVYDFGVSAGTGVFLDNPCYEVVSMPEDTLSRKANFALWVTGDSMEPRFHDGDLVLVKIQPSVEIGEIGIFVLNGEGYIKKWGGNKLVSLNPVYEPIMLTEDDALYCKGKVIGNA